MQDGGGAQTELTKFEDPAYPGWSNDVFMTACSNVKVRRSKVRDYGFPTHHQINASSITFLSHTSLSLSNPFLPSLLLSLSLPDILSGPSSTKIPVF